MKTSGLPILVLLIAFILSACQQSGKGMELAEMNKKLESLQSEINSLKASKTTAGNLVHIVYIKLKNDVDPDLMVKEFKKLEAVDHIKHLKVGKFKSLGDPRALSDYQITMQMIFPDSNAYVAYQQDSLHLKLKAETQKYMAGPPATYDYILE